MTWLATKIDDKRRKKREGPSDRDFALIREVIYFLLTWQEMQNETPELERGITDLAINWGLKLEFSEPLGQTGMAV